MKKKYTMAVLEIHYVEDQDVLTTSGGLGIDWSAQWGTSGFSSKD